MQRLRAAYGLARLPPREAHFGLSSHLRRASGSIPSNIAEGYARAHRGDYVHHLSIAGGSVADVEPLLGACEALEYITADRRAESRDHADQIRRM
jgi:four helix bundle protein